MIEFKLPDLGENIESGEVVNVLVAVGDAIGEDQSVIELETDKAVIEVPSSVAGTIAKIHVQTGQQVAVGEPILTLEAAESAAPAAETTPEAKPSNETVTSPEESQPASAEPAIADLAPTASSSVVFTLPDLGENIEGGDVLKVLVSVGDALANDQSILELETDKAVIEVPSSVAGELAEIHVKEGDHIGVGQPIATILADAGAAGSAAPTGESAPATTGTADATGSVPETGSIQQTGSGPEPPPRAKAAPSGTTDGASKLVPAAPSVRRLAREIGIEIVEVKGTGPGGRISKDDVKAHAKQLNLARGSATVGRTQMALPLPDFSAWGDVDRQPMKNVRRVTAERLSTAWATIPHVTQFDKVDTTDLEKWRKQYAKKVEAAGGKLTPTAIILKVVGAALKAFPPFNASIDMDGREVIYKKYYHVGVAVDTDRGLLVPVVRDVDKKNIIELAIELGEIALKARDRKLSPDDMQGGCFTISNLGGIGGTAFTPIVNPPEVAILGVARSAQEPVYVDGEFVPRLMMPLSLSYDHRLIDGADGARFLRWLAEALANPFLTLLEG